MVALDEIKERIHTINPRITDELLDLLYEFICKKYQEDQIKLLDTLKMNESLQDKIQKITVSSVNK